MVIDAKGMLAIASTLVIPLVVRTLTEISYRIITPVLLLEIHRDQDSA